MGATNSKESTEATTEVDHQTTSQIAEIRPRHGEQRGARLSKAGNNSSSNNGDDEEDDDDDEEDDWDKRIFSTGCADEQTKMNDCYYDKRDWRACSQEVLDACFQGVLEAEWE